MTTLYVGVRPYNYLANDQVEVLIPLALWNHPDLPELVAAAIQKIWEKPAAEEVREP